MSGSKSIPIFRGINAIIREKIMPVHTGLIQINVTSVRAAWDFYVATPGFAEV